LIETALPVSLSIPAMPVMLRSVWKSSKISGLGFTSRLRARAAKISSKQLCFYRERIVIKEDSQNDELRLQQAH
jgi:hypothetical protein